MGRELTFSDARIQALLKERFIPVADDVNYLQHQQDAEGDFFRKIAEQGHYAGRTEPSTTRQGHYAFTAEGVVLGSVNTNDPDRLFEVLQAALARAQGEPLDTPLDAELAMDPRYAAPYPEDGLVLRVAVRDLGPARDPRYARAFNIDYAWFTHDEVAEIVDGARRAVGGKFALPPWARTRLARYHCIDVVRGETPPWRPEHVRTALIDAHVTESPGRLRLALEGKIHCEAQGAWPVRGFADPVPGQKRGFRGDVHGEIEIDLELNRVSAAQIAIAGERWGGTEYNVRYDDPGPAPMGIWLELASASAVERTPPYGWRAGYFATAG